VAASRDLLLVSRVAFVRIDVPINFARRLLSVNSPDPGVLLYKGTYYAVTTSGDDANTFPIFVYVLPVSAMPAIFGRQFPLVPCCGSQEFGPCVLETSWLYLSKWRRGSSQVGGQ
jgi:hypothetical protein